MRAGGRKPRVRGRCGIPLILKTFGNTSRWLQMQESRATLHSGNKRLPSARPEVPAESTGPACASCGSDTNTRETARRKKVYVRATMKDSNTCKPEGSWQTNIPRRQGRPSVPQRIHAPAGSRLEVRKSHTLRWQRPSLKDTGGQI